MEKFRVGDIIIGKYEASCMYGITIEGWIGTVIKLDEIGISVIPLHDEDGEWHKDKIGMRVDPQYFNLYNLFPEDEKV